MLLLRSIVTGFGLALGAALFKKHVQHRLGLEDPADPNAKKRAQEEEELQRDGAADPDLQEQHA
jgi:hypothetical protein